jgi:hypothetical protein
VAVRSRALRWPVLGAYVVTAAAGARTPTGDWMNV